MKVILKQNVKNLGKKDEVIEVKPGFAYNNLIPGGFATEITDSKLGVIQNKNKKTKEDKIKDKKYIRELFLKIPKQITITEKVNENNKLFHSIKQKQIAEAVSLLGIDIDSSFIYIEKEIKSIGEFDIIFKSMEFSKKVLLIIKKEI